MQYIPAGDPHEAPPPMDTETYREHKILVCLCYWKFYTFDCLPSISATFFLSADDRKTRYY